MALRRKPQTEDEFLNQDLSSSPEPVEDKPDQEVRFVARLPADLVAIIDSDRKSELPKQSRNSWLINAAVNELKRRGKM